MNAKILKLLIALVMAGSLYNCSLKSIGVKATMPVLRGGNAAMTKESDLELVKASLPSNLMMLQGLLEVTPDNLDILVITTQAFCSYAFGFIEDDDKERAKQLYIKGRGFGFRALMEDKSFRKAVEDKKPVWEAVKEIKDEDMVPALFWTAQCMGNLINLDLTDPENLVDVPKVKAMMEKVIELDESFFYGGAHLFMASYYAGLPALFGGGLDKAQKEFDKVFEISGGKFLMAYYYYARFYAVTAKDERLFDETIDKILSTPSDVLPEQRLTNEIAKRKAKILLGKKNRYF